LSDAGRLGTDKALGRLVGMDRWADESTLGEWLRAQNAASLVELWRITREFIGWVLLKAKSSRVRRDGKLEVFFDDTQIEVGGRKFQGTEMNYKGELSYSWQTLWVGPFLADAEWGPGNRDASEKLASTLEATASLWEEQVGSVHFYADSASSAGKYLNLLDTRGWNWSVSYNKWTDKLDALASEMPEKEWAGAVESVEKFGRNLFRPSDVFDEKGWKDANEATKVLREKVKEI
jgi:hypothetical protein